MAYDAFISYSHGADGKLAPALQSALHRFAKPWWRLRAVNVFRDGTSLAAAHDLSEAIKTALADSRFFIFLASPRSAQSKWCQREVEYWIAERPPEALLIVLTEGAIAWDEAARDFDWRTTDALPRALAGVFKAEPLWLDLSWARTGEQVSAGDPRFHQSVAMLAARLHGKSLDEIAGEDVRQHRRTRLVTRAAVGALAALTISSLAGAWLAVEGQRRAERNLDHALSATDTLVTEVADGMRNFYGVPRHQLAAILGRVEQILTTLAAIEDRPGILDRRIALMTTLARANFELGELGRSEELLRKAEQLVTPLAERAGAASAAWRRLAAIQEGFYDIARRRSDYRAAEERSRRYREMAQAMIGVLTLATSSDTRHQVLQAMVLATERQKSSALDRGQPDEGLAFGREAVAAADALLAAFPDSPTARYQAALQRSALAEILSMLGRPDEAMADLDAARAALGQVEHDNPNRVHVLRALVQIEQARAVIFEGRDDWIAAAAIHENGVRVLRELRTGDPKNALLTADLAHAHRHLAVALARLGDVAGARPQYAASVALFMEALQAAPDSVRTIRNAVRALMNEAAFLEDQNERAAAMERLDRAVEIADALVRQRGADTDGVLTGVEARAARARLANLDGRHGAAIKDIERAEQLLSEAGRPASSTELRRAVAVVADLAVQWGHAGRLARSLSLVDGALAVYTPPEGVSDAAGVEYRMSLARLLMQKATAELDRDDAKAAIATAERAIALYERDILPHTRHEWAVNGFVQQLIQLGRLAQAAGDKDSARKTYCSVAPRLAALVPKLTDKPRLRLTSLGSEFQCAQAHFFLGERDEAAKLIDDLAKRIDDAVPIDAALMSEWRSIRARIANLRAGVRLVGREPSSALPLLRTAIRYYGDAVSIPAPESSDLADLAFLQEQLADLLNESDETAGARTEAAAAVATWRRAVKLDGVNYQLEIKLAEAMMTLGDLWEKESVDKTYGFYVQAIGALAGLPVRIPEQGRRLVLAPLSRAHHGAADAAYGLARYDEAVKRHRQALAVQSDLVRLAPSDIAAQLDLGRQHARLARALHETKSYAEAREECARARRLFTAHRDAAKDVAAVDRLIAWVDRMLGAISTSESETQASPATAKSDAARDTAD